VTVRLNNVLLSADRESCVALPSAACRSAVRGIEGGGRKQAPHGSSAGAAPGAANLMAPQAEKGMVPLHSPQGAPLSTKLLHVMPPLDLFLK